MPIAWIGIIAKALLRFIMNDVETWNRVVEKLAELNRRKELMWRPTQAPVGETSTILRGPYVAMVDGKTIRAYEYEFQDWIDEEPIPSKDVTIEFVDSSMNSLWQFPDTIFRWSLIHAIQYQVADAESFLSSFLKAS